MGYGQVRGFNCLDVAQVLKAQEMKAGASKSQVALSLESKVQDEFSSYTKERANQITQTVIGGNPTALRRLRDMTGFEQVK